MARAVGITITDDPVEQTMTICQATAANISSMLQDVRARRRTEIMAINGALVEIAATIPLPVPENSRLVQEIIALEKKYDPSSSP